MSSDTETKLAAETIGKTVFGEFISDQPLEQPRIDFQNYQRYMQALPQNEAVSEYLSQCDVQICITT